jgi:hypothetical protein
MSFDSDVVLIGTGVAPLVAASHFLSIGKSVLLLNPDPDFFLEDSELPLDTLLNGEITPERLARQRPEDALKAIARFFPGAIETWPAQTGSPHNFYDAEAPHVRNRARLWCPMTEELETTYVESSDLSLNPQILEDLQGSLKFPGMSNRAVTRPAAALRALMVSRFADVDVSRFRNGVLEFIRERVGGESVVCNASQIELTADIIRFRSQGTAHTARIGSGALIFWTPRLSAWVLAQAKRQEIKMPKPLGVRLWEQWSVLSRDEVDPSIVGIWQGSMVVWADGEGIPGTKQLVILRSGPLVSLDALHGPQAGASWASSESFDALSSFIHDFLRWEKCTVRGMKPRAIFEWDSENLSSSGNFFDSTFVVPGCDGPLRDVVETARMACDWILK